MIYKPITEEIQKSSVGKACQTWGDSWIRKTAYYLLKQVSTSNCLSPLSSTNLMLSLIKRKRPWNTLPTTLNVLQLAKQLFFTTPSQPLSECFHSFSTGGLGKVQGPGRQGLREDLNWKKKMFSFGDSPNKGGGGTPPPTQFEPNFLATGEFDPRNFL